jgi:hypothetical protein
MTRAKSQFDSRGYSCMAEPVGLHDGPAGAVHQKNTGFGLEAWWVAAGLYLQALAQWGFDTHCHKGFIARVKKPVSSPFFCP